MSRSERVYSVLLLAYPEEFRRRYRGEMVQAFGDSCREAKQRGGSSDLTMVWVRMVPDLASTALAERSRAMQNRWLFVVPLALALGFAIAYVDSSPGWDDTGVSAAALMSISGSFGLLYPARSWLWALAVGLWIPALSIAFHHNFESVFALLFAFAGSYSGANNKANKIGRAHV